MSNVRSTNIDKPHPKPVDNNTLCFHVAIKQNREEEQAGMPDGLSFFSPKTNVLALLEGTESRQ